MQDHRKTLAQKWASSLDPRYNNISILAQDASYRRYFNVYLSGNNKIIMDAPPEKEDIIPFVEINKLLSKFNIRVPKIFSIENKLGFLLLEHLGTKVFADEINYENYHFLYRNALDTLLLMQKIPAEEANKLINYNYNLLSEEWHIGSEWFWHKLCLNQSIDNDKIISSTGEKLIESILGQPFVFTHRDYHSRNLMVLYEPQNCLNIGVLDFQDAVWGPITYDLVSLLRDCYQLLPEALVHNWLKIYHKNLIKIGLIDLKWYEFWHYFNLTGLHRHWKALGIFSRKYLRDQDTRYLKYIPNTYRYILRTISQYKEYKEFYNLLLKMNNKIEFIEIDRSL